MLPYAPIPYLSLGSFRVSTHGLLIAAGFLVAVILARREARRRGISVDLLDNAAIAAVLSGLVGARLVWFIFFGRDLPLLDILKIWEGGLSSHGGYLFGIAAGMLYVRYKKADVCRFADAVMPYLLVGWAIGRIGCFLNWDSYGRIASTPVSLVVNGVPRIPTQLLESAFYLAAFALVRRLVKNKNDLLSGQGKTAALSLGLFALARFIADLLRDDPAPYLLTSRFLAALIFVGAFVFLFSPRPARKKVV